MEDAEDEEEDGGDPSRSAWKEHSHRKSHGGRMSPSTLLRPLRVTPVMSPPFKRVKFTCQLALMSSNSNDEDAALR
ncbi:hypothetical protein JTE90_011764 [Oedothorax gibbosus]|uniref:Uncharacterized protein n=1 Tax=Oedothorax gibbosus TaxID=931172 RepID=A0AAV6VTB6_9ARAC|nr:hypothetical protein JTE90_011764 [Oedothorax gibbosus]